MYTIQVKKHNSNVIEPVEIPQEIVPILQLITGSKESRINLMEYRSDIIQYMGVAQDFPGAHLIEMMLSKYKNVELVRH